ncbi:NACHT, LRR and PYD domains-containing protein 12-like [Colossoma macropomum]|uniref:NACHT, LRR and PYD domains-containing protein 12-like n=1 Tax=Colossoma macropomum TaxID=42526 RepID=UPI001864F28D|nr:NACHT, LRR and PYD domains-containing protein 12-like [Colossoma macropomum]
MSLVSEHLLATLQDLGEKDLKSFKWNLNKGVGCVQRILWSQLEKADSLDIVTAMVQTYGQDGAVETTLTILKKINQNELAKELRSKVSEAICSSTSPAQPGGSANPPASIKDAHRQAESQNLKSKFKRSFETLYEGTTAKGGHVCLNEVYTELYAVEGWTGGVSTEHEVINIEAESWRCCTEDTPINFSKLFQSESKVLTIGIAGVGKTIAVQKFVLDWAEEKCNQDVEFIFLIPFRELNPIKDEEYSFQQLLLYFHPELKHLTETGVFDDECRSLFIFDGLDEFRVPLNFNQKRLSGVTEKATVDMLLTNLIKGHLLPSALIWITSRPATADQIPLENINLVTEVRGFSDLQKDEYFRRTLKDEHQARRIILHVKGSKSLHIMCHIPVFCWMMATVFQRLLDRKQRKEFPKTLTEMYTNFLLIQANMKSQKYDKSHEKDTRKLLKSNREVIIQLAELAFKQLVEGNVIFYEEDLKECGIEINEPSMYYGICSEFFLEESILYQRKVYCFVHLSFQEFLAAFYVFYCYVSKNMKPLQILKKKKWPEEVPLHELLCRIVEINLWSKTGRLDLFLRFLVGLSLESNQRLLQGLLTHVEPSAESIKRTAQFFKDKIQTEDLPADRSINLILCLLEMNDHSLYSEIQEFLSSAKHSEKKLNTAHCSAIAYVLQMSEDVLDELDLKKYSASLEGCMRLIPAVGNCRKALLACCSLTEWSCDGLTSALQKVNSPLRELDLTNNDLQDSGVKLLSAALESTHCKLEILRLSGCMITDKGFSSLASALNTNPSYLRELDMSYNNPGESGLRLLTDLLKDPQCKLEKLNVDHGGEFRIKPGLRKYACYLTLDLNSVNPHLSLSEGNRKALWVREQQGYPHHPERFDQFYQVVSVEGLSGRCYWEVEWSERATVAVTYRGIDRKAGGSWFGHNEKSWSLYCTGHSYTARHGGTEVPASSPLSSRVGVYLDWPNGTLSFYSVSSNLKLNHIHTFHCRFSEPIYAGFGVDPGSSVTLANVE